MSGDDDNFSDKYTIHNGFCWQIHKAKPLRYECFGSFVNIIKGLLCIAMFVYILAKMSKNHRRALAGYTRNTINIDVHMTMMQLVGAWTICWGVLKVFDVSNTKDGSHTIDTSDEKLYAIAHCFCFAVTSFVEVIIILLLCSTSIGKNNFFRSWFVASAWAVSTFLLMAFVTVLKPGPESQYWISRNMEWVLLTRSCVTVGYNLIAVYFYVSTTSDRHAILRFAKYMIIMYIALAVSRGCQLSTNFLVSNIGICSLDLSEIIHFLTFAPVVYLTLKRDCQYWSTDVDDDEEDNLIHHANEMTWSELPNYKDVVIPKTELFYRSKIMDQVDVTVEIHLWRRKLAVVKRFKFDLLTRDNIKFFKVEANIFKRLSHDNIVDFYGVLVDPPSLGIVMKYCSNGDVFKRIEKEREALEAQANVQKSERNDSVATAAAPSESNTTSRASLLLTDMHVIQSFQRDRDVQGRSPSDSSIPNPLRPDAAPDEMQIRDSQRTTSVWKMGASSKLGFRSSALGNKTSGAENKFEPLLCALQVANGMNYLHSQDITHRDLKSMNVLLDECFNAQIADFGESIIDRSGQQSKMSLHNKSAAFVGEMGTAGWAAPEMILGRGATKASDVFSYGIVLWELLTWRVPSVMISVGMLQENSVRCHAATFEHPLLEILRQQRSLPRDPLPVQSFLGVFGGSHGQSSGSRSGNISSSKILRNISDKTNEKSVRMVDIGGGEPDLEEGARRSRSNSFSGKVKPSAFPVEKSTPAKNKRNSAGRSSMLASVPSSKKETASEVTNEASGRESQNDSSSMRGSAASSTVYSRKDIETSSINGKMFAPISDDDLTMVEVSDMRIAEELFCKRHLRPPLPVGIPESLLGLLHRCWCVDPRQRPTFSELISELEKIIINERESIEIPCEVEARINYAMDAEMVALGTDYVVV